MLDAWVGKFGNGSDLDPADPTNTQFLNLIAYLTAQSTGVPAVGPRGFDGYA